MRAEVQRLLDAEDTPSLESPLSGLVARPAVPAAIGRYRIIRLVGEGGMGAVYEAEQDQPRRTVALKVTKPGLARPELLRRFEHEAQALGRPHHQGIARICEAGAADTGFGPQPYFAMEFIQGTSLARYAEEHRLSVRQRLELVAKVCEAVHHAHQRGIIHRDLKPGNILVEETGEPKIVDFGVARATDSDARATRQTDLGQLVGTLAYMSPEQVLAADAEPLHTRVIEARQRLLGTEHPLTVASVINLGILYQETGRLAQQNFAGSKALLREFLDARGNEGPYTWQPSERRSLLGLALLGQSKFAEAGPLRHGRAPGLDNTPGKTDHVLDASFGFLPLPAGQRQQLCPE